MVRFMKSSQSNTAIMKMTTFEGAAEAFKRIHKKRLPWSKSLNGRLGLGVSLLGFSLVVTVVFSHFAFDFVRTEVVTSSYLDKGRTAYNILDTAVQFDRNPSALRKRQLEKEMVELIQHTDNIFDVLINGDPELGISAPRNREIVSDLEATRSYWTNTVRPMLERLPDSDANPAYLGRLSDAIRAFSGRMTESMDRIYIEAASQVERARYLQYALSFVALSLLVLTFVYVRSVTRRTKQLAIVADMIADGNLGVRAPSEGEDEIAHLGVSFNQMTQELAAKIETEQSARERLEVLFKAVNETSENLLQAANEFQDVMKHSARSMNKQSSAVTRTVENVAQIVKNADTVASLSEKVSSKAGHATEVSREGREAIEETTAAVSDAKANSEELRTVIRVLSEREQSISEIVQAVNFIADRTNLLALNASIEASRAGENGKGFSVVASEIRTLAGKSIEATDQAKNILEEIGASTKHALKATEDGVTKAEHALQMIEKTRGTIRMLEKIISESSQQAIDITASINRQRGDVSEVREALNHIDDVSKDNLVAIRDAEDTSNRLSELGSKLRKAVSGQAA